MAVSATPRQRVLICDDEQIQYGKLKRYLESENFECDDRVDSYEGMVSKLVQARNGRRWYQMVMMDADLSRSKESLNGIQMYQQLVADFPDENYVVYTRHDADKFRAEINRLRFREVSLVLLDEVLTQHRLRLHLTRLFESVDPRTAFLVCGRNDRKNAMMTRFLSDCLGLEVVSWERAKERAATDYIFEIVLQGIQMSHVTVVLFTDDEDVKLRRDFVKKSDSSQSPGSRWDRRQSRPNVYIEAGYARGIRQKRTLFVEWPDRAKGFEAPSDFSGIHSVRFSDTQESRKVLADRLEVARCSLRRPTDWRTRSLT